MDTDCLNLAVRNMATEDAENFKNTECLGWRHYVKSDWTVSWLRKSWGDIQSFFFSLMLILISQNLNFKP